MAAGAPLRSVVCGQIEVCFLSFNRRLNLFNCGEAFVETDSILDGSRAVVEESDDVAFAFFSLLDCADVEVFFLELDKAVSHGILAALHGSHLCKRKIKGETLGFLPYVAGFMISGVGIECILEGVFAKALRSLVDVAVVLHRAYADAKRECAKECKVHSALAVNIVNLISLKSAVEKCNAVGAVRHSNEGVHRMLGHRLFIIEGVVELRNSALNNVKLSLSINVISDDAGREADLEIMVLSAVVDSGLNINVLSTLFEGNYSFNGAGDKVRASLLVICTTGFGKHPIKCYLEGGFELSVAYDGDSGSFGKSSEGFFLLYGEVFPRICDFGGILKEAEILVFLACLLVDNVKGTVGIDGNCEILVFHSGRRGKESFGSLSSLDILKSYELKSLIAHSRNVGNEESYFVLLGRDDVGRIVHILNDLTVISLCGNELIGKFSAVLIKDVEGLVLIGVRTGTELNACLNDLASAEGCGVVNDDSGIIFGEAFKLDITCYVDECALKYTAADLSGLLEASHNVIGNNVAAASADAVVSVVLKQVVVRESDEVLRIVCAAKSCENCKGLCIGGDVTLGSKVCLLDVHSCGGYPSEKRRNGALGGGVSHLALDKGRFGIEVFDDGVLEVSESGEENVALGESVVKVFDHTNFSCVGAGGVMAFRPEAVGSCPFAFLFSESFLACFGNSFSEVLVERMGVLHIHRVLCSVNELENAVGAIPLEYAVVDIIGVEVNRTMDNIPNVVTRAGCETGSIDTGAVSAFPEEFGSGSNIGVQAAVEGCEADSKAGVDLGKLRNLTPAEGRSRRPSGLRKTMS